MSGTRGKVTSGSARPSRVFSSERFRPKALTSMRTQPGSGRGIGRSRTTSASGGAGTASSTTACMEEEERGLMPLSVAHVYSMEATSKEVASVRCVTVPGTMADLPTLFADLVRLEIELWDAVEARLRSELGVSLGAAQTLAVVAAVEDCRVHD